MIKQLYDLRKAVHAAEDKAHKALGKDTAKDLNQIRDERAKHADEYQAALVAWSLPKFADRRARVLATFAAHVELLSGVLGAPVTAASRSRAQPVIYEANKVLEALELEKPDMGRFHPGQYKLPEAPPQDRDATDALSNVHAKHAPPSPPATGRKSLEEVAV